MEKGLAYLEAGDVIDRYLLIRSVTKGVASNGKAYLTLILQDSTGDIETKVWDTNEEVEAKYTPLTVVKVGGEVISYRGRLQLRMKALRPLHEKEDVDMNDFLERAPLHKNELQIELEQYIGCIESKPLSDITKALYDQYMNDFLEYPAATKNHHEFVSGLAYHVVIMLRVAKSLCDIYPSLNRSLLYAGVILHDLGKVKELSGALGATYTVEGNLLGHITIMVTEIAKMAAKLGIEEEEEILLLQHLVLSHHGKLEYGSPKVPVVKEAEILHYIDNIDAKMNMMDRALEKAKPGEYTERVFALENRMLYRPK